MPNEILIVMYDSKFLMRKELFILTGILKYNVWGREEEGEKLIFLVTVIVTFCALIISL